jgi:hypothetical protein
MSFWNKEEPLGLPKGSIRALLALGSVGSAIWFIATNIDVPEWYYAGIAVIVAFYFVSKKTT